MLYFPQRCFVEEFLCFIFTKPTWLQLKKTATSTYSFSVFFLGTLLRHDPVLRQMLREIQGVVVRRSKVTGGQGGITVSRQGHAHIEQTEFCDVQFGIRAMQNAKVRSIFYSFLSPLGYGAYWMCEVVLIMQWYGCNYFIFINTLPLIRPILVNCKC